MAREDGSHNIQSCHGVTRVWEDGYIKVSSYLEATMRVACGWCDLHIEEDRLVGVTPTERPPESEPEPEPPSVEERVAALEEALAQTDETATALFESQAEQESVNVQQDGALLDICETLGG